MSFVDGIILVLAKIIGFYKGILGAVPVNLDILLGLSALLGTWLVLRSKSLTETMLGLVIGVLLFLVLRVI